jgi:ribonuclease Z
MPKLIILGSANAIPDERHENVHLAIQGSSCLVLVDCVGAPTVRLKQAGLDIDKLTDLILTHFHPDHVSGVPSLLMSMWLLGRQKLLNVYGLHHTIDRIETVMNLYEWEKWPDFFPVAFHRLPSEKMTQVLENDELRIHSSPVQHLIPTIGLRIEARQTGQVLAYSCDTEPCRSVIDLAEGAHTLIHEATGEMVGHSSASQAGEIAKMAGAESLYLIHYPTGDFDPRPLVDEAKKKFPGPVALAEDFMMIDF